jgi:Protein kinase domain
VKVLHAGTAATEEAAERFQREARTAAKLSHPHIVSVFDAGIDAGQLYLVMELVEGHPLDRLIGTPRLTVETTLRVVFHLAQALEAAHARGIIHRDVKPANVLIDAAGRPKLTDFGLARLNGLNGLGDDSPALSRSGDLIGTPRYMSPEQALLPSDEVDHRTDLYSLGAVMYEMLTGVPVADGPTALAVLRKVTDEAAVPVTTHAPQVPAEVAAICHTLLAKDRDRRYANAADVAKAIQDFILSRLFGTPEVKLLAGLPALSPVAAPLRTTPKWPWLIAGILIAVAGGAAVWFGRPRPDNGNAREAIETPNLQAGGPTLDPSRVAADAAAELRKIVTATDDRVYRGALSDLLDGLNAAVKQHPSNGDLRAIRGRVLRRAGESLSAISDIEAAQAVQVRDLELEKTLARYQWEVITLNGFPDSSLRPVPSKTLAEELRGLAGRADPVARLLSTVGVAVVALDGSATEKSLATALLVPADPDLAMIEADALARLANDAHQEADDAEPAKKPAWRVRRDEYDTRGAQAIRRGLAADPHHLGLLFLKAAAWHRRVKWDTSDGDDRDQLERRHRPAFEAAYQRYRVGCLRLSLESATGRAVLLAGAGRNDQALDPLNEAAGRGPLPPAVAAMRAWLQLAAPPDWELTPTHAAGVIAQLAPAIELHPEEFTLYLVRSVAMMATARWEDSRRDLLDGKKVYRGAMWPPPGSCWSLCRDVLKSPTQYFDTALDHLYNFPTTNETKLRLGEEFLRRIAGPDESLRKGITEAERRELAGWAHFRQAKFYAEKDNRAAVLRHTRSALEMKLADLNVAKIRSDGNLKAWNDDAEFQKLYAEFARK